MILADRKYNDPIVISVVSTSASFCWPSSTEHLPNFLSSGMVVRPVQASKKEFFVIDGDTVFLGCYSDDDADYNVLLERVSLFSMTSCFCL